MTREEVLELARLLITRKPMLVTGQSISFVQSAELFAHWILEVAEVERHELFVENNRLHERCSDLLEHIARLKREIPTEPDLRTLKK